jgi:protein TonB
MFDAIASPKASGRSARSIAFSVAMHCAVVGAALGLAWLNARGGRKEIVQVVPLPPLRPTAPPPGTPSGNKPQTARPERATPRPTARPMIEPREIPQTVESPTEVDEEAAEAPGDAPEPGMGSSEGIKQGIPGGSGLGPPEGAAPGPIDFDDTMTPPRMLAGPAPEYTREALEREIEGTMLVKCVVTTQGIVRTCRVLKSLPFMDRAVIEALEHRRYAPALLRGRPVDVDYTFRVHLTLPQ